MTQPELMIKMILTAWESQNKRVDGFLTKLTDEQLLAQTAPDRNTGIYLLGHLTAVNDGLFSLLGLGEKLYPELENIFLANPDNSGLEKPSLAQLKEYWKTVNAKLSPIFEAMSADEWLSRHTSVTEEDFAKEPHRNRLNVLISRTIHQGFHLGQLTYLG